MSSLRLLAAASLAAFLACAPRLTTSNDAVESDIQGGDDDVGDPAVGMLTMPGGKFCTGTLITPTIILTAGHCLLHGAIISFDTTNGTTKATVRHAVSAQASHPSYRPTNVCPNPTLDIALVELAAPITDVAPKSLGSGPPNTGASCRAVGFGHHIDDGGANVTGTKRAALETVTANDATSITVTYGNGIADHGDSGGPLFCDGDVIYATTSCHSDGNTATHKTERYAPVAAAAEWIAGQIASWSSADAGAVTPPPPEADASLPDAG